jgi:hypothetical protein
MKRELILAIVFLLLVGSISALVDTKDMDCGNNVCEKYSHLFETIGETDSVTIEDVALNIKLLTKSTTDSVAIWDVNGVRGEMSTIWNEYLSPINNVFDYQIHLGDYRKYDVFDYMGDEVYLKEEQYCPLDCIGEVDTDNWNLILPLRSRWNLVHLDKVMFLDCNMAPRGTICKDDVLATFVYVPFLRKYINIDTAHNEYNPEQLQKIQNEIMVKVTSAFVYLKESANNKKYAFTFFKGQTNEFEPRDLKAGWNFVGITQDMYRGQWNPRSGNEGEYFSWDAIKGNCNYEKIYYWNPEKQNWNNLDPATQIKSYDFDDFLGLGMIVKVSENCTLSTVEKISSPPGLPTNGEFISCVDEEGEINPNKFGEIWIGDIEYGDFCTSQIEDPVGQAPMEIFVAMNDIDFNSDRFGYDYTGKYSLTMMDQECTGSNCILAEVFCTEDMPQKFPSTENQGYYSLIWCANGCKDGACL